jgi:hypothetical protein
VQSLSLLSLGLLLVVTVVIGFRLVRLAGRTRRLPELLIGLALLCFAPLGYGLMFAARMPGLIPASQKTAFVITGLFGLTAGATALYAFVWQVFRPSAGWARSLCYACFVALIVSTAGDVATRLIGRSDGSGLWFWSNFVMRTLSLAWAGSESMRYWRMMCRRLALGLADPLTTSTFLLWGLGAWSAAAAFAVAFVTRAVTGHHAMVIPEANAAVCVLAVIASATIFLAFFPPAAWVRVVNARAPSRS